VPDVYTFVQREYWGVGFLHYYQRKQLPNFVLAAPAVLLSLRAVRKFRTMHPEHALHLLVSVAVAVALMNVQVATRFLCSSSPAVYWFTARTTGGGGGKGYFTLLYFSTYVLVGTAAFACFYPWT